MMLKKRRRKRKREKTKKEKQTRSQKLSRKYRYKIDMEKEMATHSSVLAWRIPGTGEPGGLPSLGSHRVGHD